MSNIQNEGTVSLPNINQKRTSETPNVPIGGYLTLERVQLTEPARAFNIRLHEAQSRVNGSISPEAMVPDVHSEFLSLP